MKPLQIERTFIEMLEAVDANEAEIVCLAKDKKLQTKYEISSDVVKKAFPVLNILSIEPQVEKTNEEKAAEYIELAKVKKAEAKKLFDEAKQYILKAEKLNNENA